jgi:hypothetical protein
MRNYSELPDIINDSLGNAERLLLPIPIRAQFEPTIVSDEEQFNRSNERQNVPIQLTISQRRSGSDQLAFRCYVLNCSEPRLIANHERTT